MKKPNNHYKNTRKLQLDTNLKIGLNQTNVNHTHQGTCINFLPLTFDFYVNLENYTTDALCGMTIDNACKDLNATIFSLAMVVEMEGKKGICFEITATIFLMTDLIDYNDDTAHACRVKVPPVEGSILNIVKTNIVVKSFDVSSPRKIECYTFNYGLILDSTGMINTRSFENIRAHNILTPCLSAVGVYFFQVQITSSMDYSFKIINSTIISSHIEMNYGSFEMVGCVTDSDITISGAESVLFERNTFSVNLYKHCAGPSIRISHAENVEFSYCIFEFSRNSLIEFKSVVQVDISHSNFTYFIEPNPPHPSNPVSFTKKKSNDSEPDDMASITANLVFRIFVTKCIFTGRRDFGWISWISVGKINFARSVFNDNVALSAKAVVSLYLCQEVRFVDCSFLENKSKHSGAVLIDSSDFVTVKNSRFYNNTSFKSGGAISLLSISATSCFLSVRFFKNSALNGNGGAILLDENSAIRVQDSWFHSNNASIAGGAIYIRNTSYIASILDTYFFKNSVYLSTTDEELFKSGHFIEGSGGAVSLINTHTFIIRSRFYYNHGLRGGACFSNGKLIDFYTSEIEANSAFIGGGVFHIGTYFEVSGNPTVKGNSAIQYGSESASSILYFNATYDKVDKALNDETQSIYVYPGQRMSVMFYQMIDTFHNNVPILLETVILEFTDTAVSRNFGIFLNQTSFSNTFNFHISLKKDSIDLKEDNYFILRLKLPYSASKFITVHLVPCKTDYVVKDGVCQLGFPYSQVIPGIVVASILVMMIGIIIGSCLCSFLAFSIWRIYKKIKKVNVREKSEKEIEEKLLTYDVSYSDYGSLHSVEIEKNSNYIIPASELKFEKKIGEGASGSVYQAKWNTMDVAVKSLVRKDGSADMFEKEVMVLVQLRHVNIINFYGICISETQSYMVVELGQNGSLEKLIKSMKKGTAKKNLKEKLKMLIGIANGMKYLHGLHPNFLIHRDLKPANIILDYNDNPKVCDFGLSRTVSSHTLTTSLTANIGTLLYMCPELILEEESEQQSLLSKENAKKIDVYAFAIIMWELFFEEAPYWNDTCEKINYFNHVSVDQKKIKAFNLLFFVANQEKRPFVPFIGWNEMKTWCEKFLHNELNPRNADQFLSAVDGYIKIMKSCWSTNPTTRPSFDIIMNMLTDLYEMDF